MSMYERMQQELQLLESTGNLRVLPQIEHHGTEVIVKGERMLNLSSNDYLGLACREDLRTEFVSTLTGENFQPTSSSSRLLTGNYSAYDRLEKQMSDLFGTESALIFNSGYHANMGILPAVCNAQTLILADKLVHASIIDGIRLTSAKCIRFRHNHYEQLARLLEEHHTAYEEIIIVTESIFSMDGDKADLKELVRLKKLYPNVLLYVDEAHAFGVCGEKGLGLAEEENCIDDIDFLVGTFGKALASAGAYIVCKKVLREYLVNKMRTLIFTTALPPVCLSWTSFLLERLPNFKAERNHLRFISQMLKDSLIANGYTCPSDSHILPMIIGESSKAIQVAKSIQRKGFYALPVRPPTVPEGTSRIRFSLSAALTIAEIERLISIIPSQTEIDSI